MDKTCKITNGDHLVSVKHSTSHPLSNRVEIFLYCRACHQEGKKRTVNLDTLWAMISEE